MFLISVSLAAYTLIINNLCANSRLRDILSMAAVNSSAKFKIFNHSEVSFCQFCLRISQDENHRAPH